MLVELADKLYNPPNFYFVLGERLSFTQTVTNGFKRGLEASHSDSCPRLLGYLNQAAQKY